jgi:hypothetical protein
MSIRFPCESDLRTPECALADLIDRGNTSMQPANDCRQTG